MKKGIVISLLVLHTVMLTWSAWRHSPTWNEVAHLPAGICVWRFSDYSIYCVNPPLVRAIAALPVLAAGYNSDENTFHASINGVRRESDNGKRFIEANGKWSLVLFPLARMACVPFSLLAAWICFIWARELYGFGAGILAIILWCFSPLVLGHAALLTPDVGTSALGIAALYFFWRWLKLPNWERTIYAGIVLGLAELCKFTLVLFYALLPLLWILWIILYRKGPIDFCSSISKKTQCLRFVCLLLISITIINVGYEFQGSFRLLKDYRFRSTSLKFSSGNASEFASWWGNRFENSLLGYIPVPLPKDYVGGIDLQKVDFENTLPSYLCGEWRDGGWYHYYIYGLLVKEPLGTWCLFILAIGATFFSSGYNSSLRNEMILLMPLITLLVFISAQTGVNCHLRYLLPIFPMLFIWISKVAKAFYLKKYYVGSVVIMALLWMTGSSVYYYPHSMSYFNELAGGPKLGHYHLGSSNVDWGQDLLYLRHWMENNPNVKFKGVVCDIPFLDVSLIGIPDKVAQWIPSDPENIKPGWYAISVNKLHSREKEYQYFLPLKPVASIGYTMNIYHVTVK